jgi:hypothetical protein
MPLSGERWKEVSPSQFTWEREALDYIRQGLPDCEPYRAWSNFEFIADDGSINEVYVVADPRIANSAAGSIDEIILMNLFCKLSAIQSNACAIGDCPDSLGARVESALSDSRRTSVKDSAT